MIIEPMIVTDKIGRSIVLRNAEEVVLRDIVYV